MPPLHDISDVELSRLLADAQCPGELAVRVTGRDQRRHLQLARSQRPRRRGGPGGRPDGSRSRRDPRGRRDSRGRGHGASLRSELLRRREADQARDPWLREAVGPDGYTGELADERAREWRRVDEDNAGWLRALVTDHGWPGQSAVGTDGARAAWLLAVHAQRDLRLQQQCLRLMGEAVGTGEAAAADWAVLLDRVLLSEGRAQLFGTQLTIEHATYQPEQLYVGDCVDALRSAVGLDPMDAYLAEMTSQHPPLAIRSRTDH